MYEYEIKNRLSKKLQKVAKKDYALHEAVMKKILQVAENPYTGKPLRDALKGKRRVHIGHFVLVYEIDERKDKVIFLEFEHHDEVYK